MRNAWGICGLLMFAAVLLNLARITYRDFQTPELWDVDWRTDPRLYLPVCLFLIGIMVYPLARDLWQLWRQWQMVKTMHRALALLDQRRVQEADELYEQYKRLYRKIYGKELKV